MLKEPTEVASAKTITSQDTISHQQKLESIDMKKSQSSQHSSRRSAIKSTTRQSTQNQSPPITVSPIENLQPLVKPESQSFLNNQVLTLANNSSDSSASTVVIVIDDDTEDQKPDVELVN